MSSKRLGGRLAYIAASAFVTWHTLAVIVAPLPDSSAIARAVQPIFYPYLTLFMIGHTWDFYSPNVGTGHQLRYSVEGADGKTLTVSPIDEMSWWHPAYWWFKAWHTQIIAEPDEHGDGFAAFVCAQHAGLKPVAITLLEVQQADFVPADHLDGRHPLEPDYVNVNELKRIECP